MKSVRRLLSFSELVFLYDTYSGSHIYIHCDDKFFTAMNKQHGLLVMNHTFELDWLATWCVADRYGQLFVSASSSVDIFVNI